MPQMKRNLFLLIGLLLGLFLLGGCGSSSNSVTARDPATGTGHQAGWLPVGHSTSAKSDLTPCTTCHGGDLSGGIAKVSCTQCHLGSSTAVHPATWINYAWAPAGHAAYVGTKGNSACANIYCHGADLSGVDSSGPSCTSCHLGGVGSVHPQAWGSKAYLYCASYVGNNGTTACANIYCHGADLSGVANSGPSCSTACHMGIESSVHPQSWDNDILLHATYVNTNGTSSCRNTVCHGADLKGVDGSGVSCFTCHNFSLP
jgi:hypothetical protein